MVRIFVDYIFLPHFPIKLEGTSISSKILQAPYPSSQSIGLKGHSTPSTQSLTFSGHFLPLFFDSL